MDSLISLIVIGAFILKMMKKSERQKGRTKQAVPNQSRQSDDLIRRSIHTQRTSQVRRDAAYYYQQQKNTKERLQKKYGSQKNTVQKSDILSRARENVQEKEPDMIQQQVHAEVCRDYQDNSYKIPNVDVEIHKMQSINCDTIDESDMMKKVNDLIVTGYSGEMHFDRDFIAEGVELLNQYSL